MKKFKKYLLTLIALVVSIYTIITFSYYLHYFPQWTQIAFTSLIKDPSFYLVNISQTLMPLVSVIIVIISIVSIFTKDEILFKKRNRIIAKLMVSLFVLYLMLFVGFMLMPTIGLPLM